MDLESSFTVCREVVEKDVTGFLFQPGNNVMLAGLLRKLLLDSGLRCRMGQAGRKRVERYFNEYDVAKKVMALYEETLGAKKTVL